MWLLLKVDTGDPRRAGAGDEQLTIMPGGNIIIGGGAGTGGIIILGGGGGASTGGGAGGGCIWRKRRYHLNLSAEKSNIAFQI